MLVGARGPREQEPSPQALCQMQNEASVEMSQVMVFVTIQEAASRSVGSENGTTRGTSWRMG
jgi:hypothetical protein